MRYNVTLLKADILDELNNLKKLDAEFVAIKNLLNHRKEDIDFFDKAATGYFLHNFYNGCENVFGMIARFFENDLGSQSWHRDLLKRMKLDIPGYRPRLIDDETFDTLNEFRAFRHVFRHCYSFHLDWEREIIIAMKYPVVWEALEKQVLDFLKQLDEVDNEE